MGGRIYDASIGRFLQADPIVQSPLNSQNYNRYSYVLNNPMSYTDPSGYIFKWLGNKIKKYWRQITVAVVSYFTFGAASGWAASWGFTNTTTFMVAGNAVTVSTLSAGGYAVAGAIAGAAGGAVSTGSLRGAVSGAIAGLTMGYASHGSVAGYADGAGRVLAASAGGCASASLAGGSCGKGARLAGLAMSVSVSMELYSKHKPTWDTAEREGVVKIKDSGVHDSTVSNIGKSFEVDPNSTVDAMHLVGKKLSELSYADFKLLEANYSENAKLFTMLPDEMSVQVGFGTEAAPQFNDIARKIPGFNSMSVFHDVWMARQQATNAFYLAVTIPPSIALNYTALGLNYYKYIGSHDG